MQAENNNDIAITEAKLKDFLSSVLSSEGIVVDIRRTFIEYNGVNRSRVFARHANRMACKGSNEKFVVIALLCYPALQWLLKAQDIDALIEKLKEENEDESVWRMSNIQRILESSMGGCKPQLRLEMRKLFFARCQQLVDEIDEAMNKAVFMNPASKPSRISLAMAMLRGSILDSDPVTAVTIRNNFDSIVEDVTAIAGDVIKPLVMQLAPNEGEAKTAEAAYLYHNTEVLLREYSRIVNPSVADENRSLRILAQGGNTLESDARCHQAQVLVQYAQLIRGAIELVKDFPGDSKLYDVLMLNAQKAKLIIAACLSFFVGTFLALYTKNLPTFGAGVLVAAYFLVEFLTMLKNSKADKYIKVTALAVNADESRAGFEPMETWRFIPVNEDGEYLDKNGKYDIFLQVKPRDREYHIGALYDMLFCAGDGERLTQDNLVAIEQNSVKANVQKEGLLHRAKNRPIQESEIEKQESASSETESKTDVEDDEP